MLVYEDLMSGDVLLSDTFSYKELFSGVLWEVEGKWVTKGALDVDANASAEGGGEDKGVENQAVKAVDIVHTFRLQELPRFDKKEFMYCIKQYMKSLLDMTRNFEPVMSKERRDIFEKEGIHAVKFLLSKMADLQFFAGESMNPEGMVVFAYYKENATDPTFLYIGDGLKGVKC